MLFNSNRLPSTPNERQLCRGKRAVIVHSRAVCHKFDDEPMYFDVAILNEISCLYDVAGQPESMDYWLRIRGLVAGGHFEGHEAHGGVRSGL